MIENVLDTPAQVPTQEHIDTSRVSRDKLNKHKNDYRRKVYAFISNNMGATCEEVELGLSMRHETTSGFIRFLTQDGYLKDSGTRRQTRSGRSAIVWIPTQAGEQLKFF